jgi:uncharacterized protein (TIGR02246 family)
LAAASLAWSAEKNVGTSPRETDSDAALVKSHATGPQVSETLAAFEKCFNSADAKALAALWKSNGSFKGPRGERILGRENIETAFQQFFAAHKNCKLKIAVVGGHLATKDVAIVEMIPEMTPAPDELEGEPRSTIVFVLQDGRWMIDSITETVHSAPMQSSRLKDLAWLIGDWAGTVAGSSVVATHSTCEWTANRSFLIRKFSVSVKDGNVHHGTEVIGWDPRAHRIRSWVFESDGGFGQSEWTRDGDRWTIKFTGVLPDGGDVSATHVLSQVDADTLKLQSIKRHANGQKRPDVPEVTLKRCPAKAAPKAEPPKPPRQVLP